MLLMWFIYATVFNFFAAQAFLTDLSRKKRSDDYLPCESGWFLFRDKCYKAYGRMRNERGVFDKAETHCIQNKGQLVSIHSKEELDFIFHFLLLRVMAPVWIGLQHRGDLKNFSWSDGSPVNFTNWKSAEPSNQTGEDCVEMLFDDTLTDTQSTGQWNDVTCDRSYGYICQMNINRRRKSRNPMYCPAEDRGGWKFGNSCYHVVMEVKTWQDAEKHCQNHFNGHLATVLDKSVDVFLDYLLSSINKQFWIGMKITDELQPKWTSGWFIAYNHTNPAYAKDGTCVLRNSSKAWTTIPCSIKHPFLCEVSKVSPPVLKPAVNGSYCPKIPKDWKDLGGEYCYFFELEKNATWYYANYECQRRGGNLLSIHSKEESDVINPFIKFRHKSVYFGLMRLLMRENVFVYSDGSAVDFENWSFSEPNNEEEKCGELWSNLMEWNDIQCSAELSYICSVRKVTPNMTTEEKSIDYTTYQVYYTLLGVSVCLVCVVFTLVGVIVYCIRSRDEERRKMSTIPINPTINYCQGCRSQGYFRTNEEHPELI